MIMANFCQTAGNEAQGEKRPHTLARTQTSTHLHYYIHTNTQAHNVQADRQLLIELR